MGAAVSRKGMKQICVHIVVYSKCFLNELLFMQFVLLSCTKGLRIVSIIYCTASVHVINGHHLEMCEVGKLWYRAALKQEILSGEHRLSFAFFRNLMVSLEVV